MLGWLAGGVVVAGGGLYCWAYGPAGYFTRDRVKLRALRADPMSSTTLLGLRAFGVEETEPSSWFSIEPLSRMRLTRRFQEDGSTSEDLMGRLVAYAQEQGWAADPDPSFPSMWIGGRPRPPGGGGGGRPGPLKGAAMGLSITRYPQAPPTDPLSTIVQVELFY
jgi:hypothetical protein